MSPDSPRRSSSATASPPHGPVLFDVVRVRQPVPELSIRSGDEGTVVEVLEDPDGYLVYFSYEAGYASHALPVYGLIADQVEVVGKRGHQVGQKGAGRRARRKQPRGLLSET